MGELPSRLRSVLYMPGANQRALQKATEIPADGLILDLEDAVAPAQKPQARELACAAAASGGYGERVVTIRVNAAGTPWHEDDLRAVAQVAPDAVVLPKVDAPADVLAAARALEAAGAPEKTRIWAMLETPRAVLGAAQIAAASERLAVLVLGTNDLVKELYAEHLPGREPLLASLSLCVLAARAAGRQILDGVYNDVRDLEGLARECRQGRALGFDGKTVIHPGQVAAANAAFSPGEAEVQAALRVIAAFEQAQLGGAGVVVVDGRLVENLHVESARRTLELAGHQDPSFEQDS